MRIENSLSLDFTEYFKVVRTKPCATLVSLLPTPIPDKTAAKKRWSLTKIVFFASKQPFAVHFSLASCNVCHVAIPEIFAQTQGSDYWQLIHYKQSLLKVVAMFLVIMKVVRIL